MELIQTLSADLSPGEIDGIVCASDSLTGSLSASVLSGDVSTEASMDVELCDTLSLTAEVTSAGGGSFVTDKTLTLEGRAADAKAVGDKLATIDTKIAAIETEVGDASILLSLI